MKLKDFSLFDEDEQDELAALLARFNDTQRPYPRESTVHAEFMGQATQRPEATAVVFGDQHVTYGQLDELSGRMANFLLDTGVLEPEGFVGLMMDRRLEVIVALLGILKAGGAYVPLNPNLPYERLKFMIKDTQTSIVIGERQAIRQLNKLQWECPSLAVMICMDSEDVYGEIEEDTEMMDLEMWRFIADTAVDDISGGGWKDSYTGELLSREVMDAYGENIHTKLAPLVNGESRVLEIGSASGISMFRLAPLVGNYVGTDLSEGIVAWSTREAAERELNNIRLRCLAAHEIDQLEEDPFDVAIINSVIELFPGHNYLRQVLRKTINQMKDTGWLFLGNVWDQDLKDDFLASLHAYKREHPKAHTKLDREGELFISRHYLEDLRHDFPEIAGIDYSQMLGTAESELSLFGFDALIRIDKTQQHQVAGKRHKRQYGRPDWLKAAPAVVPEQTAATGMAYIMYTSGSTGQPKGVMVEHRSILRLVMNTGYLPLDSESRTLQTGALAFDASTLEIWGALLNGGTVYLPTQRMLIDAAELSRLIREQHINILFLTTALFNQMVDIDVNMFAKLRVVMSGGEKVSVKHFQRFVQALPDVSLLHVYGPTENTTYSTYYPMRPELKTDVPIGYPIPNSTVYILDQTGRPVPVGEVGEICVGGDGLARGYLNRPELTAERFVTKEIGGQRVRIYKTGDLGRWQEDGAVEFLGRVDNQVKIRGYRIEPEEITAVLLRHDQVYEAIVLVKELGGDKQLLAYFTAADDLTTDMLRKFVEAELPDYMMPSYFTKLNQMPLNQSGKIDWRALPKPNLVETVDSYVAPQTETEKVLANIWEEVLERPRIGLTDNFFNVGGHSLKVTKLVAAVEKQLGVIVPLATVFNHPTVEQLAEQLLNHAETGYDIADKPMVLLNRQTGGRPLFAFPPGTGDALGFVQLAEQLTNVPFYGFNFIEAETRLSEYADLVMSVGGDEPYRLFGYSSGGNLAYYVAQELEKQGKSVEQIIMVDSGRRLRPFETDPADVENAIAGFLQHESIRPYLDSPVLMEKQARLIRRSFAWIDQTIDSQIVQADIVVLLGKGEETEYYDAENRLVSSVNAWAEVTNGRLHLIQAHGTHNEMLYPPHLAENIKLLQTVLGNEK